MRTFNITGMACSACSARVETVVSKLEGITSCSVNLLTNSMSVEGSTPTEKIMEAVEAAGFGISLASGAEDKETPKKKDDFSSYKRKIIISLVFLLPLMYTAMGKPPVSPRISGLIQALLSLIVIIINRHFYIRGVRGVIHRAPNMDTLVSLGSGASYIYSLVMLLSGPGHDLYFESSAMILVLISVGKALEAYSKGKTTSALDALIDLTPAKARVIRNNLTSEIPVTAMKTGDIFIVKAGESVPADGVVIEGATSINESMLTGESLPVEKRVGSEVSAGTVNHNGVVTCRTTAVSGETSLAKIIEMVKSASASKAPIARIADRVSSYFVPVVILISIITYLVWMLMGEGTGFALTKAISVLVISCPCSLGLATPVAIMVAGGMGAKTGILFKTASALEETGKIKNIVLDKTGTITTGKPAVTEIISCIPEQELRELACACESRSEHPVGKAVTEYYGENSMYDVSDYTVLPGHGVKCIYKGKELLACSFAFAEDKAEFDSEIKEKVRKSSSEGKTPVTVIYGGKPAGVILVADEIRQDSREAVAALKSEGINVFMLTGDNRMTASYVASQAGIDNVISEVLPGEKQNEIKKIMLSGRTAMVGDGINDAPALTAADTGIAIGTGTDVAIDSADVVLMNSSLSDAVTAVKLSKATLRNIKQNLFWAFIYNVIGIPVAAGALSFLGISLSPMIAAACMSLSSFCVVSNSLRLYTKKFR